MKQIDITRFPKTSYAYNEAINTLCTNLSFVGSQIKKIMLTSSHAAEGKTFTSMSIMKKMADLGYSIVHVDADLRKSVIEAEYGLLGIEAGLSHFLAGKASVSEIIYETNFPGAYMIPVGKTVSNPLTLLNSSKFDALLNKLAERVDYVIVDAPPLGTVIDAAQIARSCDGTLVVIKYNSVSAKELINMKEQLEQTKCPIIGSVLSMVEYDSYMNKKYYYKSYYSHYENYYGTSESSSKKNAPKALSKIFTKEKH